MYVRQEQREVVLQKLQVESPDDTLFTSIIGADTVHFRIVPTGQPYIYTMLELPHWARVWKIYFNARCGRIHPGFAVGCMPTFGEHAARGNAMTWAVNNWQSCERGDSICIEKYKPVGTITYYRSLDCSDTTTATRNIMRFRCD